MTCGHAENLLRGPRRPDIEYGSAEDGHVYDTVIRPSQETAGEGRGREGFLPEEQAQYPGRRTELAWDDVADRTELVLITWRTFVIGVVMPDGRQVSRMSEYTEYLPPKLAGYVVFRGYAQLERRSE